MGATVYLNKIFYFDYFFSGNIASGGAGAATVLCVAYPLDLARTRLAVDMKPDGSKRFNGIYDCTRKITNQDGIRGMYRGFLCSLQFVVISRAAFFGMFDTLRCTIGEDPKKLSFFTTWFLAQVRLQHYYSSYDKKFIFLICIFKFTF